MVHISHAYRSLVIRKCAYKCINTIFSYLALMLNLTEKACMWSFTEATLFNRFLDYMNLISCANPFTACIFNSASMHTVACRLK